MRCACAEVRWRWTLKVLEAAALQRPPSIRNDRFTSTHEVAALQPVLSGFGREKTTLRVTEGTAERARRAPARQQRMARRQETRPHEEPDDQAGLAMCDLHPRLNRPRARAGLQFLDAQREASEAYIKSQADEAHQRRLSFSLRGECRDDRTPAEVHIVVVHAVPGFTALPAPTVSLCADVRHRDAPLHAQIQETKSSA
jgi:hypothetical protein